MNWIKRVIKTAAAQSKINKLGIANPALKFFVHKYENSTGIDWNKIKSPADIETHIYSKLLPELYKKIDKNNKKSPDSNYLKSEHLDIAAEIAQHPDDPQVQAASRIYERDPEAATQHILEILNQSKKESFQQWWNYLTQESDIYRNNPAFMYSILKPIIDSSPESAKNGPPPVNAEVLAHIWEEINEQGVTNMNILKQYRKISSELDSKGSKSVSTGGEGEWIQIPSKITDPENYKENLDKLMRFAQGSGWCIAGNSYADQYLSKGDFWLYLLGGRAMVAIRMEGSNKVAEIRGHQNDLKKLEPYWQEVTNFLHQSPFDYKNNAQYKHIEEIFFMNTNLEKGTPDYNTVLEKIKTDHKAYLRLSDENRQKFPEFLDAAKDGYRKELDNRLIEMESPTLTEGSFLRQFEKFQEYYKTIPEEIKVALGDMNDRLLQAHKKAYHNNPIIFTEFSPEMQKQFSKKEQISAWTNYINQDPYHYNDKRIPDEIKSYISKGDFRNKLKEKWRDLILKNAEHAEHMSPAILELFNPGEIENYILQDFASLPVSIVHGKFDKLERIEKMVDKGIFSTQQIIDILSNSIKQNPKWYNRLPQKYKDILIEQTNVKTIVDTSDINNIIRDPGYFKSLSPEKQNAFLQSNGRDIGEAFAKTQNKYRGLLHEFWTNTPVNVRPYLPESVIENVAQFYANAVGNSLSTFQTMSAKIPTDIHPRIVPKLSYGRNWYKKAFINKFASVTYWIEGSDKISQPMSKGDISNDLARFVFDDLQLGQRLGFTYQDFDPDMSEGNISDSLGNISIYLKNPNIKAGIIENILDKYNQHKQMIHLTLLNINQSGIDPSLNAARISIDKNDTVESEQLPTMNLSNSNSSALLQLLQNEGVEGLDPYGGVIPIDTLKQALNNIEQNDFMLNTYTQEPTEESEEGKATVMDFGRSYEQISRYINGLKEMIAYVDNNNLPVREINYG